MNGSLPVEVLRSTVELVRVALADLVDAATGEPGGPCDLPVARASLT